MILVIIKASLSPALRRIIALRMIIALIPSLKMPSLKMPSLKILI